MARRAYENPAHKPEEGLCALETLARQIEQEQVGAVGAGRSETRKVVRFPYRVARCYRETVGTARVHHAPVVGNMPLVHLAFVSDLERGEPVDAEVLVDEEEGVEEFAFFRVVHLPELFRLGQAVCYFAPDADDGGFVYTVDIERDPVGLPNFERGQYPFLPVHPVSSVAGAGYRSAWNNG